jgi:dTDP-4-amino-4,6-dideoxy-D-galactose acyltransferase
MIDLIETERTAFYSPYGFLNRLGSVGADWIGELAAEYRDGKVQAFDGGNSITIYFRKLEWDSQFFAIPTFRVDYVMWNADLHYAAIGEAFISLRVSLAENYPEFYLFSEVPCEDTAVITGMGSAAWRLIETRITCFRDDLRNFESRTRYPVRNATTDDVPALREAAIKAVNHFDRFHADEFFTNEESDNFLGIFIENSVKGFADEVIVPQDGPANAFLTGNYVKSPPSLADRKIGRMVLSAVSAERRGWYVKLIGELSERFKERGMDSALMTTQATNRAVLKVWERHGYRFGRCTHIFSTYIRKR